MYTVTEFMTYTTYVINIHIEKDFLTVSDCKPLVLGCRQRTDCLIYAAVRLHLAQEVDGIAVMLDTIHTNIVQLFFTVPLMNHPVAHNCHEIER